MKYEHLFFIEMMNYTDCRGFLSHDPVPSEEFIAEKLVELTIEYGRYIKSVHYHGTQDAVKGKDIPLRYA